MLPIPTTICSILLKLLLVVTAVFAGTENYNPTGEGCVDARGFLSCYAEAVTLTAGCVAGCKETSTIATDTHDLCLAGCNGAQLAGNLACWVQSCWNQLHSCEHQLAVISYFDGNSLVQSDSLFPWFPPPSNAVDGACLLSEAGYNIPCQNVAGEGDIDKANECSCCEWSLPISNILNICPTQDLSILGVPHFITHIQSLIGASTDGCEILNTGDVNSCQNTYGYIFQGAQVYNPLSLPSGIPGTDPLTNNPGNAFTDFGVPAFTFNIFPGFTSTVTPVPFNSAASAVTGDVDSGSEIATPTDTASSEGGIAASGAGDGSKPGDTKPTAHGSVTNGGAVATTSKPASGEIRVVDCLVMICFLTIGVGFSFL
ncbi:hypothetical protein BJ878DRAFT_548083 [Calycina marina]|uniref:Uncharacterized protein n=1 Tax=Calycina marina TaxID=1763456 RepID=A0A9P8CFR5_9HELO|nr:hypothetical protein BJ878DRAFT_548083 [Calycina marina]